VNKVETHGLDTDLMSLCLLSPDLLLVAAGHFARLLSVSTGKIVKQSIMSNPEYVGPPGMFNTASVKLGDARVVFFVSVGRPLISVDLATALTLKEAGDDVGVADFGEAKLWKRKEVHLFGSAGGTCDTVKFRNCRTRSGLACRRGGEAVRSGLFDRRNSVQSGNFVQNCQRGCSYFDGRKSEHGLCEDSKLSSSGVSRDPA
jgi:hypothetical protein